MDALNFLKFWRSATVTTTTTSTSTSTVAPHLVVETDSESDEEDSFFDLELTVRDYDNKENNNNNKSLCSNVSDFSTKTTTLPLSPKEQPISKRKVLPMEPISKPQSPISILRSAPSFRISMFRRGKRMQKTEEPTKTECETMKDQKKETRVFAVKLNMNMEDFNYSPALSRDNSTRSFGSKVRSFQSSEEQKPERFSKEVLQKYLKLIKPLYVKVSKRYTDKAKFTGEGFAAASPSSSPSVSSVSSRREKQGSFPVGMRVVSKHLGKRRSAGTVVGVNSPANRSNDSVQQHDDGIQSAILHCKRSFNSRECSIALSADGSMKSARNSFEDEV
ncbi:membrane-associated kinase regulator 5 [Lotus japonicus]|uniref:membrane-associated kinase regulator 5 n=1 Tax=Lotus japonicus TaxID=34305 RepID=UPI002584999A|nr:membrane-associated kinase regulator 5 [Lotus japonicus]